MGQNVLSQSDRRISSQLYLQNKSFKSPDFLHVDTNSHKLTVNQKEFWLDMIKIGVARLVMGL